MSISNGDADEIIQRLRDVVYPPARTYAFPCALTLRQAERIVWEQTEGQQMPQPVVVSLPEQIELSPHIAQLLKTQQGQGRK